MRREGCCCRHQEACVQTKVTLHTSPPGSLCSLPLPGSYDPGTTSLGEHTACLRTLQRHVGLCCRRLNPHSIPLPPPSLSEPEPPKQPLFNPVLSGWGTDALRWPTCRGRTKSKAEPQELCEQTREREISPSCLKSSRLNLHNQLDVPCIYGMPKQTTNHPKMEAVDFGSNCRLRVCFYHLICFWFYISLSSVFKAYYHW